MLFLSSRPQMPSRNCISIQPLWDRMTVKKEDGIYSATFYNLGKGKAVELYGYWLKSDLTTLYDSGRNTGLTKLDEFHKNQAKIEQEKYWTRMFWNWILPALIIALWLLALLGRNRFKKMIWPGVTYPTSLVFARFHIYGTSCYELGCLFSRIDLYLLTNVKAPSSIHI